MKIIFDVEENKSLGSYVKFSLEETNLLSRMLQEFSNDETRDKRERLLAATMLEQYIIEAAHAKNLDAEAMFKRFKICRPKDIV